MGNHLGLNGKCLTMPLFSPFYFVLKVLFFTKMLPLLMFNSII